MNFPLCLTLSRVFLAPLFAVFYLYHKEIGISFVLLPYVLIGIALVSEVTDVLDGFLARKLNKVTELGKILDPMADSIFRFSVLCVFTQGFLQVPILLVLVFFYRDSLISTLRTICALKGFALAARLSGKIKAVVLAAVAFLILLMMIPYSLGMISLATLQAISFWSIAAAAVYVLYTACDYIYANRGYIRKVLGF